MNFLLGKYTLKEGCNEGIDMLTLKEILKNIIDQTFMAMIVAVHESSRSPFYGSTPCLQEDAMKKTSYGKVLRPQTHQQNYATKFIHSNFIALFFSHHHFTSL